MQEQKIIYPNDTTRALIRMRNHLISWKEGNERCNPREVAIVITKIEEAILWSYEMVKNEEGDSPLN